MTQRVEINSRRTSFSMKGESWDIWAKTRWSVMEIKQTGRHVGPEVVGPGLSPDHKIPPSGRLPAYHRSGPGGYLSFTVVFQFHWVTKLQFVLWVSEGILLASESLQGSKYRVPYTQKPVDLYYWPVWSSQDYPSCFSLLKSLPPEIFFSPFLNQEQFRIHVCSFLNVFSTDKALSVNQLNRNCSQFPFMLIEAICA